MINRITASLIAREAINIAPNLLEYLPPVLTALTHSGRPPLCRRPQWRRRSSVTPHHEPKRGRFVSHQAVVEVKTFIRVVSCWRWESRGKRMNDQLELDRVRVPGCLSLVAHAMRLQAAIIVTYRQYKFQYGIARSAGKCLINF